MAGWGTPFREGSMLPVGGRLLANFENYN
jgi:hypothetical protein